MTPEQPSPAIAADQCIEVEVNGETQRLGAGTVIDDLLDILGLKGKKLAVARNRNVVPRSAYATERLQASDRIEILEAVGGG